MVVSNLCNSQSLEEDKIYATQFLDNIYLDNQLRSNVNKIDTTTIHILESNEKNQVTRELNRLSDSTFLYTEYEPMSYEEYVEENRKYRISKQGILEFSSETIVDSSEILIPWTYGKTYPSPRLRNIYKQTGPWFEKYGDKNNTIEGTYNLNGKHGKWYYYNFRRAVEKILTYENGTLIKEEIINILNYKSTERTRKLIQRTWACSNWSMLSNNHTEHTKTYTFGPDGTFIYGDKKGTWSLLDYKTIEYTMSDGKRKLNLEYVRDNYVRFVGEHY